MQRSNSVIERKIFDDPPTEYRTLPFWSWNGKLNRVEVRRQVQLMKSAGIGGFFMHARAGLLTPYMKKQWMDAIRAAVEEAELAGMEAWCYDENGWPSGAADGIIPRMGKEYQQKWLEWSWIDVESHKRIEQIKQDPDLLYLYNKIENDWVLHEENIEYNADLPILAVYCKSSAHYVDLMSSEMIDVFLEACHEQYREQFGAYFGKTMKGIFTDEPQYDRFHLPWSHTLEEAYQEEYGTDISQMIPNLLIGEMNSVAEGKLEQVYEARYSYWKMVSKRFTLSAERIGRWCREAGWEFTGHVMAENDLVTQMNANAGVMSYYEFMDVPGMDFLGRDFKTVVIAKQVSSVARQLGKKFAITETFGCCGWNLSLDEMKGIAEWQFVLGINKICQHLESYSLEGVRKRDYPPSIFYQQPWWPSYRAFNDYFARLTYLLTLGKSVSNLLIIHPIRTAWMLNRRQENQKLERLSEQFRQLSTKLLEWQCDYDYGDEGLLEKYAKVENGQFIIGEQSYTTVMLPGMIQIERVVVEMLGELLQQGGTVIVIGEIPKFVSGKRDDQAAKILSHVSVIHFQFNQLDMLIETLQPTLVIKSQDNVPGDTNSIYVQQRQLAEACIYYCVNISADHWVQSMIHFKGGVSVYLMDMNNGNELYLGACEPTEITFQPRQSYVFIVKQNPSAAPAESRQSLFNYEGDLLDTLYFSNPWNVTLDEPNAITLDYAKYRIDGNEWLQSTYVLNIQEQCILQKKPVSIELEYTFTIDNDLEILDCSDWKLAVENMEKWEIQLNDYHLESVPTGWYRDQSINTIEITPFLRNGENKVRMTCEFKCSEEVYEKFQNPHIHGYERNKLTFDSEVESIYILGSFGVRSASAAELTERQALWTEGPFTIEPLPSAVNIEDATPSGLWFYAGRIFLSHEIVLSKVQQQHLQAGAKFRVIWDEMQVPSCRVWVNGKMIKECLWRPFQLDLTNYMVQGACNLTFELMTSCRNLLGPHHHVKGELHFVGPSSFTDKPGWTDHGLNRIWTDRYCFVRVGLSGLRGEITQ